MARRCGGFRFTNLSASPDPARAGHKAPRLHVTSFGAKPMLVEAKFFSPCLCTRNQH